MDKEELKKQISAIMLDAVNRRTNAFIGKGASTDWGKVEEAIHLLVDNYDNEKSDSK